MINHLKYWDSYQYLEFHHYHHQDHLHQEYRHCHHPSQLSHQYHQHQNHEPWENHNCLLNWANMLFTWDEQTKITNKMRRENNTRVEVESLMFVIWSESHWPLNWSLTQVYKFAYVTHDTADQWPQWPGTQL